MFDAERFLDPVVERLCNQQRLSEWQARLLCRVEISLFLLEQLELLDEKVTALWAVLTGLSLPRLKEKMTGHEYAIAMARLILPYSGRFAWDNALKDYAQLPPESRIYDLLTRENYREYLVATSKSDPERHASRYQEYADILTGELPWSNRKLEFVPANKPFRFYVHTRTGRQLVHHQGIPIDDLPATSKPLYRIEPKAERTPLNITLADLERTAAELDKRLIAQGKAPEWLERYRKYVNYHTFDKAGKLSDEAAPLNIKGIAHVVGMVGAGKSTLMKLLAAYFALFEHGKHITLVVGDTMTVLDIVNELNTILVGDDPATLQPVAVPLIGRTTRERHLTRFYNSVKKPEKHWALRWLRTECLLLDVATVQRARLDESPLAGREPCNSLDVSGENAKQPVYKKCPFYHHCPSHQLFHDLPQATISVTTPGAMAKSSIPTAFEQHNLSYGEFMYLHADLVIMDEVDTLVEWFDNVYAEVLDIWGNPHAALNRADPLTSTVLTNERTTGGERRWIFAARHSVQSSIRVLEKLTEGRDNQALQKWLSRRYFTAFTLFNRLARRFVGVWDWENQIDDTTQNNIDTILEWFEQLTEDDPTNVPRPQDPDNDPTYRLSQIIRGGLTNELEDFVTECEHWICQFLPTIEADLLKLNARIRVENQTLKRKSWHHPAENIRSLARKLALVLMIVLLDHNLRIVFYEDYNQPATIETGAEFYSGSSRKRFGDLLPLPPTGRIFGTYYANTRVAGETDENPALSRFEYRNIGRWYLLHFDVLLADLGLFGPNALALSGTSWLPDSTRWHFDIEPKGVMLANKEDRRVIHEKSSYRLLPQSTKDKTPIAVSGEDDMNEAIQRLASALVNTSTWTLQQELGDLHRLGEIEPKLWKDRERLLLLTNSYEQAELVGKTLRQEWRSLGRKEGEILYLSRGDEQVSDEQDAEDYQTNISRGEIEKFATNTSGKILVAPMDAVGRGYNILNQETGQDRKAAFGAIYFLVRPMPHPYDIQALAGELNARTLQWYKEQEIWRDFSTIEEQALAFRRYAKVYWNWAEMRVGYHSLGAISRETIDKAENNFERLIFRGLQQARVDLAASTFGKIVQANGRLVRGGVPFHAYFIDAKWAPMSAAFVCSRNSPEDQPTSREQKDNVKTSLLAAIQQLLSKYVDTTGIGKHLYQPFEGLLDIENLFADLSED